MDTTTKIGAVISMGGGLVISIFHGSFLSIAMSGVGSSDFGTHVKFPSNFHQLNLTELCAKAVLHIGPMIRYSAHTVVESIV